MFARAAPFKSIVRSIIATVLALCAVHAGAQGNVLSTQAEQGAVTLSTCSNAAEAFCSLTYRNVQYINATDHGRLLQSAASFDYLGEAFNPTEGGSRYDGNMSRNGKSRLRDRLIVNPGAGTLATEVQMAFWDPVNGQSLSNHLLRRWVQLGVYGNPRALLARIDFEVPANEFPAIGQFEVWTGYMPSYFSKFWTFDPVTFARQPLGDGPGEQPLPIIFSTEDEQHAMAIWSPSPLAGGGYGRWRCQALGATDCVKWNMVSRITNPRGTQQFLVAAVIGTVPQVLADMRSIIAGFTSGTYR